MVKGKAKARDSQQKEKGRKFEPDDSVDEAETSGKRKDSSGGRTKVITKASSSKIRKQVWLYSMYLYLIFTSHFLGIALFSKFSALFYSWLCLF